VPEAVPSASAPGAARPVTPLGIAAGLLDGVLDRAAGALDDGCRADLERARLLVGGLEGYVASATTPASDSLDALELRTAAEDWRRHAAPGTPHLEQEMLSGHVEGALLGMLVRLTGARRVLEVGMFTGYSALAMAQALPADEPGRPAAQVVACELDPGVADFARRCFDGAPAGDRIRVEVGPATDTLVALAAAGETFDLVFVDADKPGYAGYVDAVLGTGSGTGSGAGLLAPGGLVCLDNTLLQGEPWAPDEGRRSANGRAIADFNARLAADPRVEQVLVPLRDGVTLLRRAGE